MKKHVERSFQELTKPERSKDVSRSEGKLFRQAAPEVILEVRRRINDGGACFWKDRLPRTTYLTGGGIE